MLEKAVRAHGNNTEYVPIILIGLGVMAMTGASAQTISILGGTLFVARIFHAYGIQQAKVPNIFGMVGNIVTWLVMLWLRRRFLCRVLVRPSIFTRRLPQYVAQLDLKTGADAPFLILPRTMICGEMGCRYDRPISSLLRPCERNFILCTCLRTVFSYASLKALCLPHCFCLFPTVLLHCR